MIKKHDLLIGCLDLHKLVGMAASMARATDQTYKNSQHDDMATDMVVDKPWEADAAKG